MLRLVFTIEDLARTRIAELGPMAETQLSLQTLQSRNERALFDGWRRRTRSLLPPDTREAAPFLAGPGSFAPDLYTPLGPVASIDEGRDRLLGAPPDVLRTELFAPTGAEHRRPSWLTDPGRLSGGLERLAEALVRYHEAALAPHWHRIQRHVRAHISLVSALMATGGITAALNAMTPLLRWDAPALHMPNDPAQYQQETAVDIHLNGRGLLLAPTMFCGPYPMLFTPLSDAESILIYPIPRDAAPLRDIWSPASAAGSHKALAALLGATRAAVLSTLADFATTTEIARCLDISPPSVSQHTGVLRQAGLITSTRHRNTMHHSLTPQGIALLNGTTNPAPWARQRVDPGTVT